VVHLVLSGDFVPLIRRRKLTGVVVLLLVLYDAAEEARGPAASLAVASCVVFLALLPALPELALLTAERILFRYWPKVLRLVDVSVGDEATGRCGGAKEASGRVSSLLAGLVSAVTATTRGSECEPCGCGDG